MQLYGKTNVFGRLKHLNPLGGSRVAYLKRHRLQLRHRQHQPQPHFSAFHKLSNKKHGRVKFHSTPCFITFYVMTRKCILVMLTFAPFVVVAPPEVGAKLF